MAPEDPHSKIQKGVSLARKAVDASASRRSDIEADAWEAVRAGVKLAKRNKDLTVLDGWSDQEMMDVLHLLVQRSDKKPVLRSQVVEILITLLSNTTWLSASQADPSLATAIQNLGSWKERLSVGSGELQELVEKVVPVQACSGTTDALQANLVQSSESALDENLIKFREGVHVMQEHGWQFPLGQTRAVAFDGATEAFEKIHDVTKQLSHAKGDSSCDELECFSQYWPSMLLFFQSLYQRRPPYRSRVRFVATKLALLSSSFGLAFDEFSESSPDGPWHAASNIDADKHATQAVHVGGLDKMGSLQPRVAAIIA